MTMDDECRQFNSIRYELHIRLSDTFINRFTLLKHFLPFLNTCLYITILKDSAFALQHSCDFW